MKIDRAKCGSFTVRVDAIPVGECFTFDPEDPCVSTWMRFKRAKRRMCCVGVAADEGGVWCVSAVSLNDGREDAFTPGRQVTPLNVTAHINKETA